MYSAITLWLLIIRLTFNLLVLAFNGTDFSKQGMNIFEHNALIAVDLAFGVLCAILIIVAIVMEAVSEDRIILEDVFFLAPLVCAPLVLQAMTLAGKNMEDGSFTKHYFLVYWPLLLLLYLVRYFRVLGRRALLADTVRNSHQTTRSVDFIWSTRTRKENEWLVHELSRSLGPTCFVRLHRFLTKQREADIEEGGLRGAFGKRQVSDLFQENELAFKDHYGYPDWQSIFKNLTSKLKNGTTVGIFFCGPPRMAADVKKAATLSMLDSRYRAVSNSAKTLTVDDESGSLRLNSKEFSRATPDALTRSFNVRYVFREEKF